MMKIFVTGGAGYVGSVVTELLVREGHEVTVFDSLATGHRLAVDPGARLVVGNLRDPVALREGLGSGTDAVLHFASRSSVTESVEDPIGYYEHNVGCATTLLRGMAAQRVRKIVFSSSAGVYGAPEIEPIPETAPLDPTHAYGGSKHAVEMLLADAGRSLGVQWVALRYFNAAGASERYGEDHRPETHLLPNVLRSAHRGTRVSVYGEDYETADGTTIRDYVHVLDLARAHLQALDAIDQGLRGAMNLGSGRGSSVQELIRVARRVTGQPIPVTVRPRRPGDVPSLVAGIERAACELDWTPRFDLEAIVTSAWSWMQQHPRGYEDPLQERGTHGTTDG